MTRTTCEMMWLKTLMAELDFLDTDLMHMHYDNQGYWPYWVLGNKPILVSNHYLYICEVYYDLGFKPSNSSKITHSVIKRKTKEEERSSLAVNTLKSPSF